MDSSFLRGIPSFRDGDSASRTARWNLKLARERCGLFAAVSGCIVNEREIRSSELQMELHSWTKPCPSTKTSRCACVISTLYWGTKEGVLVIEGLCEGREERSLKLADELYCSRQLTDHMINIGHRSQVNHQHGYHVGSGNHAPVVQTSWKPTKHQTLEPEISTSTTRPCRWDHSRPLDVRAAICRRLVRPRVRAHAG